MKGIIVLSFHKKPGAFVDREYPAGITKKLKIDDTEQNKVYSLHRMRNTKPNYLFIKSKGVQIASFYSGFDLKQYVGRPNQTISIILEAGENPTRWEDQLRRLTHDLLPVLSKIRGNEIIMSGLDKDKRFLEFDELLEEKFQDLQDGLIAPMIEGEGEHLEGTGAVIEKISSVHQIKREPTLSAEDIKKASALAGAQNIPAPVDPFAEATAQMEEMEKDGLRDSIRNLQQLIKEKDERVRAVEVQLRDAKASGGAEAGDIPKIRGEYEALIASKESELDMWRGKVAELNEKDFINQDTIRKTTEMMMMMTEEQAGQAKSMMNLRKKLKALQAKEGAPSDLGENEVGALRSHLAEVEEDLKQKLLDLDKKQEQSKQLFKKLKASESNVDDLTSELGELKAQLAKMFEEMPEDGAGNEEMEEALQKSKNELKFTQEQLILATNQLGQAQDALAEYACKEKEGAEGVVTESADSTMTQIQVLELEDRVKELEEALTAAKSGESGDSNRLLENKVQDLELLMESMKKELVTAKKTIKVQRREVDNLRKLLDL